MLEILKNLINWKPLIQFEKGLIQTIKYYKEKSDKKNIKKNT